MRALSVGRAVASAVVALSILSIACEPDRVAVPAPAGPDGLGAGSQAVAVRARVLEPLELGFTNPVAVAFSPRAGSLLVATRTDAPAGSGTVLDLITLAPDRAGVVELAAAVPDPVNLVFDAAANRLLMLDMERHELLAIGTRPDGSVDPGTLTRSDARLFGVEQPLGMSVDPASGRLFILDAAGPRIVRVTPDPRLGFERPMVAAIDLGVGGWIEPRGLAFDPTTGHLHVLDVGTQILHEVTMTGQRVATRDLAAFTFYTPGGMTFAPSGDTTDDPAELSLYIADSGKPGTDGRSFAATGQITEVSLRPPVTVGELATPSFATAPMETGIWVQTIATSAFAPPSPDPAGITYLGHVGRLLISDSEVNETSIFAGVNLFEVSPAGTLVQTGTTMAFSDEPTGATWNPVNHHLFLSDDVHKEVYEVDPGADGLYGTADDVVTSFDTAIFGSNDPEGVTYDFVHGVLYVVDGVNSEVYRVAPGANGIFNGVPPTGDDQVTSFDTQALGLLDPEGIAYDADFGHLYVVGRPANVVFHLTTTGILIRTINIGTANPKKPAGLAYAPGSVNPGQMNLWIVDRGVDNNSDPNENDGKVYEFALPPFSGNVLPQVTITAPANGSTVFQGTAVTFTGTASDAEDGDLTASLTWTSSRDGSLGTGGTISTSTLSAGTHTITASVTDRSGGQGAAAISVTVNIQGQLTLAVRVAAGSDDAEESAAGGVSRGSSDLELVFDGSNQTVGMRFTAVTIPRAARIINAYVQFEVDETGSQATSLIVQGQAADNAPTFGTATGNISSRSRTASATAWSPPPWTTVGVAGVDQRTPDLAAVIQEIINRPGWSSGNALVIIITGTGHRTAVAFEGLAAAAPLLHIDYLLASNTAPVASTVAITGTAQVGQLLTGNYTYSDVDGDLEGTSLYRWLRNGAAIAGATARTYTVVSADQGTQLRFEVTPVAATGASPGAPVQSAAVVPTAANSVPVASTVAITGTAQVGQVLTGSYTYSDVNGDLEGNSLYRWLRNGAAIPGATARTYTVVSADQGTQLRFEVTPVAATGASPGLPVQSAAVGPVAANPQGSTLEVRVAASSDDAEESATGTVSLSSSDLELVLDGSDQTVGMRFRGVAIPRGATIVNAYVQFQVDAVGSTATSLSIQGEATDNALTFTTASGDISSRTRTASTVSWSPPPWPTIDVAGVDQRTPNIASVIQAIVSRPGWSSGNALVIIITGTGKRTAESYNGVPTAAPLLHVEYAAGS